MRWIATLWVFALGCSFSLPTNNAGLDDAMTPDTPDTPGTPDTPLGIMVRTRRIDITDAQVTGGPHTNFPLLISLTQPWLRNVASGGDVLTASGFDIGFFADAAGTMRLAHEIEQYTPATGELVAWVKVPMLERTSELFIRYGDPAITTSQENRAAVWSNSFAGVWHLNGGFSDATANANNGTNTGTVAAAAQISGGRSFGAGNFVAVGSGTSIDDVFIGGGTVDAWFRAAGFGQGGFGRIMEKDSTTANGWLLAVDNATATGTVLFGHGASGGDGFWSSPANSVALNAWTHVAVTYDQASIANNPTLYLNGQAVAATRTGTPTGNINSDASFDARIGNRSLIDRAFDGLIDEVRLSRTVRSVDWITTSYRNQSNPAGFYTVGPEL